MKTAVISETDKAMLAERQTTADAVEKVFLEFAIQGYPDTYLSILRQCKLIGVTPSDFSAGYLKAVATNLYVLAPSHRDRRMLAKAYAGLLYAVFMEMKNVE